MKLQFEKIEDGYLVKVPFEIKDAFKEAFKTAKWANNYKMWKVGVRSKKRLERFNEEFEAELIAIAEMHAQQEKAEFEAKEQAKIKAELEKVKATISKAMQATALSNEIAEFASKEQVKEERVKLEAANKEYFEARAKVEGCVNETINVAEVEEALSTINRIHSSKLIIAAMRTDFCEAQEVLENSYKALLKIGIFSRLLRSASKASFRHSSTYDAKDLYRVRTIEQVTEERSLTVESERVEVTIEVNDIVNVWFWFNHDAELIKVHCYDDEMIDEDNTVTYNTILEFARNIAKEALA